METKAKCKFCYRSYVYHPGGATTTLNRHLANCTQYQNKLAKAKAQGTLNFGPDDGNSLVVNPTEYDHEHTRELIAKMIIAHEYSFRMVEHKWFNILTKWMNGNYEFIGRKSIKNECMRVYESKKNQLKRSLKEAESISLTTDLWTSNQNLRYMCLVAHYIDENWVLQCRVLSFIEVDPPHTGIVIAQAVFECMVEWKIEDKVTTITLDNATNNDTAVTNLKAKLLARKNSVFDPNYFHIRCAAHIVNLVVNDGLQPIDNLITCLRNTVKYFKRSPSQMYKFVEVCNNYSVKVGRGLALDVKTRWNSTYKMLDTCIAYKDAFGYYEDVDTSYVWKPSDSDWVLFEKIRPILGTMAEATTAFSGSLYPTANCFYPYIVKVKRALIGAQQSGDTYLMSMAAAMLEKFDKYWEEKNNVMVIATILDPRFKMRYIKWCFAQIFDPVRCEIEINDINQELERLYNKYEILNRQKMGDNGTNRQSTLASLDTTSSMASVASDFQSFLQSSATESSKSELLIYLDEPNEPIDNKHFNLLRYWNVNCHRFPVVSSLAKRFLAVPVSSVSSECTFSNAGRVLDDYRSSLKPATVQALVCASSWIRGTNDDNNHPLVVGDDEDDVESIEFPKCMVSSN
ncbi:zinc finger BED domain-containing protein RICESLEEPER 2-like [Miscanthus floridulus]|uniref:zinc finger BED domain-containing protein RICESLEEPER 2-like n=1 Tax=Miscanthus floridulus TaxID=154761 RepID=UPI003457A5AC